MAIRLRGELEQRLARLARQTGRTETSYAREAHLAYLEELEDPRLANERLAALARRWSQEDLEADVDLVRPGARHGADARLPTG